MKKISNILLVCLCLNTLATNGFAQRRMSESAFRSKNITFVPTSKGTFKPTVTINLSKSNKKGILDCDMSYTNCMVSNMPLLNQSDPRIDRDLHDMSPWGCYDTSIVTVINTALANRKSSFDFGNRTKIFDSFVGNAVQPKEIKQLSYQYRIAKNHQAGVKENGKVVQPLYFHEVVADFNKGKILQQCDPYIYGDCDKLGNTAQATNLFGDAFRIWISTEKVTNEDIIKLMEEGYVVMIAFVRYKPVGKFDDPQKSSFTVNFTKDSFHKVVFSGFQKGAEYPLIINDVGTGERYNVRLSDDLSKRMWGQGGLDKKKVKIIYPAENSGANTKNFIEYEGSGKNTGDMVFFLDHYDTLRIKQ